MHDHNQFKLNFFQKRLGSYQNYTYLYCINNKRYDTRNRKHPNLFEFVTQCSIDYEIVNTKVMTQEEFNIRLCQTELAIIAVIHTTIYS